MQIQLSIPKNLDICNLIWKNIVSGYSTIEPRLKFIFNK